MRSSVIPGVLAVSGILSLSAAFPNFHDVLPDPVNNAIGMTPVSANNVGFDDQSVPNSPLADQSNPATQNNIIAASSNWHTPDKRSDIVMSGGRNHRKAKKGKNGKKHSHQQQQPVPVPDIPAQPGLPMPPSAGQPVSSNSASRNRPPAESVNTPASFVSSSQGDLPLLSLRDIEHMHKKHSHSHQKDSDYHNPTHHQLQDRSHFLAISTPAGSPQLPNAAQDNDVSDVHHSQLDPPHTDAIHSDYDAIAPLLEVHRRDANDALLNLFNGAATESQLDEHHPHGRIHEHDLHRHHTGAAYHGRKYHQGHATHEREEYERKQREREDRERRERERNEHEEYERKHREREERERRERERERERERKESGKEREEREHYY